MSDTILIDRNTVVGKFNDMLEGRSNKRILRVVGHEKMGKSRLLREFRKLTKDRWQGNCALVDLRSKLQSYGDIVFQVTQQIPSIEYINFATVQQQLSSAPKVEVSRLNLLFSTMSVSMPEQKSDSIEEYTRQKITSAFYKDLSSADFNCPVVLLFDTFDGAGTNIQNWLNEQLLVALLQIPRIYVVLAGRVLPDLPDILIDNCDTYLLPPVSVDDYVSYCNSLNIIVSQETIEAFYIAFDGVPGLFSEIAPKLIKKESL